MELYNLQFGDVIYLENTQTYYYIRFLHTKYIDVINFSTNKIESWPIINNYVLHSNISIQIISRSNQNGLIDMYNLQIGDTYRISINNNVFTSTITSITDNNLEIHFQINNENTNKKSNIIQNFKLNNLRGIPTCIQSFELIKSLTSMKQEINCNNNSDNINNSNNKDDNIIFSSVILKPTKEEIIYKITDKEIQNILILYDKTKSNKYLNKIPWLTPINDSIQFCDPQIVICYDKIYLYEYTLLQKLIYLNHCCPILEDWKKLILKQSQKRETWKTIPIDHIQIISLHPNWTTKLICMNAFPFIYNCLSLHQLWLELLPYYINIQNQSWDEYEQYFIPFIKQHIHLHLNAYDFYKNLFTSFIFNNQQNSIISNKYFIKNQFFPYISRTWINIIEWLEKVYKFTSNIYKEKTNDEIFIYIQNIDGGSAYNLGWTILIDAKFHQNQEKTYASEILRETCIHEDTSWANEIIQKSKLNIQNSFDELILYLENNLVYEKEQLIHIYENYCKLINTYINYRKFKKLQFVIYQYYKSSSLLLDSSCINNHIVILPHLWSNIKSNIDDIFGTINSYKSIIELNIELPWLKSFYFLFLQQQSNLILKGINNLIIQGTIVYDPNIHSIIDCSTGLCIPFIISSKNYNKYKYYHPISFKLIHPYWIQKWWIKFSNLFSLKKSYAYIAYQIYFSINLIEFNKLDKFIFTWMIFLIYQQTSLNIYRYPTNQSFIKHANDWKGYPLISQKEDNTNYKIFYFIYNHYKKWLEFENIFNINQFISICTNMMYKIESNIYIKRQIRNHILYLQFSTTTISLSSKLHVCTNINKLYNTNEQFNDVSIISYPYIKPTFNIIKKDNTLCNEFTSKQKVECICSWLKWKNIPIETVWEQTIPWTGNKKLLDQKTISFTDLTFNRILNNTAKRNLKEIDHIFINLNEIHSNIINNNSSKFIDEYTNILEYWFPQYKSAPKLSLYSSFWKYNQTIKHSSNKIIPLLSILQHFYLIIQIFLRKDIQYSLPYHNNEMNQTCITWEECQDLSLKWFIHQSKLNGIVIPNFISLSSCDISNFVFQKFNQFEILIKKIKNRDTTIILNWLQLFPKISIHLLQIYAILIYILIQIFSI